MKVRSNGVHIATQHSNYQGSAHANLPVRLVDHLLNLMPFVFPTVPWWAAAYPRCSLLSCIHGLDLLFPHVAKSCWTHEAIQLGCADSSGHSILVHLRVLHSCNRQNLGCRNCHGGCWDRWEPSGLLRCQEINRASWMWQALRSLWLIEGWCS